MKLNNTNAITHGLTSNRVLPTEDQAQYDALQAAFWARFRPADPAEEHCVRTMVDCVWRQERTIVVETEMMAIAYANNVESPEMEGIPGPHTPEQHTALAFDFVANKSQDLHLVIRYQAHLRRSFDHAFRTLQILQGTRPSDQPPQTDQQPLPVKASKSEAPAEEKPFAYQCEFPKLPNEIPTSELLSWREWPGMPEFPEISKPKAFHAGQTSK